MRNNNNSILALQHSGGGARDFIFDKETSKLQSLWIEIPDYCHLNCPYCYADTRSEPESNKSYLSFEDYKKILTEFSEIDKELKLPKYVGIPGKGEPFDKRNWELTKKIIDLCAELGLELAIFTTGDSIFFDPTDDIDADPKYDKFKHIEDKNVILLIKCNSRDYETQNKLVRDRRNKYAQMRERAIKILIDEKWNEKRKLGIVTSVVKENKDEIVELYEWAKVNNIIFDCDTILERGRGKSYTENGNVPSKSELDVVFKKLKDAGISPSCQGGTYVGCTCDRLLHHLYISVKGDVYPCIGCLREDVEPQLKLGHLSYLPAFDLFGHRHENLPPPEYQFSLKKAWEHPLRKQLAYEHKDTITGVCQQCQNFINELCYSCLGRCISKVEEFDNGRKKIRTHGCIHHKPATTIWLVNVVNYLRKILSFETTKNSIKNSGLESLWQPNKNIAYLLQQLNDENWEKVISRFIDTKDSQDINDSQIEELKTIDYLKMKHYYLDDIEFPINTSWDFIKDPYKIIHRENEAKQKELTKEEKQKFIDAFSGAFLSNVFIPSVMILLRRYDNKRDTFVNYLNFMLYDDFKETYFYRSFTRGSSKTNDKTIQSLIVSRWTEDFSQKENLWKNNCLDLSDFFSDKFYSNYTFQIGKTDNIKPSFEEDHLFFDLTPIFEFDEISAKVNKFTKYVTFKEGGSESLQSDFENTIKIINEKIFKQLSNEEEKKVKKIYTDINDTVFFKEPDKSLVKKIYKKLNEMPLPDNISKDKIQASFEQNIQDRDRKLLNYFVYLAIFKKVFNVNYYNIIYSANFRENSTNSKNITLKPNGLLICTETPLNADFRSKLSLYVSNISAPFDEFYHKERFIEKHVEKEYLDKIESHRHTLKNFIGQLYPYLDNVEMNQFGKYGLTRLKNIILNITDNSGIEEDLSRNPYEILKGICEFVNDGNNTVIAEYPLFSCQISIADITNSVVQLTEKTKIDYFNVIFNLIHNATKFLRYPDSDKSSIKTVIVKTLTEENNYTITIFNPGLISDKKEEFINKNIQDETIKQTNGLAISKRLAFQNDWKLSCNKKTDEYITIFTIKI